jgi:hypothetical protein
MERIMLRIIVLTLLSFSLEGCLIWPKMIDTMGHRAIEMGKDDQVFSPTAPQPIHLSSNYGDSFRMARDNQILNPEASDNLEVVEGLNGTAGILAIKRYQGFFKKPPFGGKKSGGSGKK